MLHTLSRSPRAFAHVVLATVTSAGLSSASQTSMNSATRPQLSCLPEAFSDPDPAESSSAFTLPCKGAEQHPETTPAREIRLLAVPLWPSSALPRCVPPVLQGITGRGHTQEQQQTQGLVWTHYWGDGRYLMAFEGTELIRNIPKGG